MAAPWPETAITLTLSLPGLSRQSLYVGVTSNLVRRVYEHRNGLVAGHTKRYSINQLVYFEVFDTPAAAIQREKNIKHWPRVWKTRLIAQKNPSWRDPYDEIAGP